MRFQLIEPCSTKIILIDGDLNVILEFCSNGSLLMFLRSKKDNFNPTWSSEEETDVTYSMLVIFLIQAASGMEFLESKKVSKGKS